MPDIFISYKQEDRQSALKVAQALSENGYDVWWDVKLLPGQKFADEINTIINESKAVIVLWTKESVHSSWVKSEALLAFDQGKLVPAWLEEVRIPTPFNAVHTVDLSHWCGNLDDQNFQSLLHGINEFTQPNNTAERVDSGKETLFETHKNQAHEVDYWLSVVNNEHQSAQEYKAYVNEFGEKATFSSLAKLRIEALESDSSETEKSDSLSPEPPKILKQIKWLILYWKDHIWIIGLAILITILTWQFQPISNWITQKLTNQLEAALIPEMVSIPPGCLKYDPEDEQAISTTKEICFLNGFKMSKFEITFTIYEVFAQETEREINDNGWGKDNRPAIFVSHDDATAFLKWLNKKVKPDREFRLPSESEWEYAARGGSFRFNQSWYFGNDENILKDHAYYRQNSSGRSHPVGQKLANPFNLHDMIGNVFEWTNDCYTDQRNFPEDGSAKLAADCRYYVLKGGSWNNDARYQEINYRIPGNKQQGFNFTGIRIVQDK